MTTMRECKVVLYKKGALSTTKRLVDLNEGIASELGSGWTVLSVVPDGWADTWVVTYYR